MISNDFPGIRASVHLPVAGVREEAECWGDTADAVPGLLRRSQSTTSTSPVTNAQHSKVRLLWGRNPSQPEPVNLYTHSSGVQRYAKDLSIGFPLSKEEPGGLA